MPSAKFIYAATIKYGHFPQFLAAAREIDAYERAQNVVVGRYWNPLTGPQHLRLRQMGTETIEGSAEFIVWQELELGREFK